MTVLSYFKWVILEVTLEAADTETIIHLDLQLLSCWEIFFMSKVRSLLWAST